MFRSQRQSMAFSLRFSKSWSKTGRCSEGTMNDTERRRITDALGSAGSIYRETVYQNRLTDHRGLLSMNDLLSFLKHCLAYVDHSIAANRREDKLFHSYNLVEFGESFLQHSPPCGDA